MYVLDDLFNMRSIVGERLAAAMKEQNCSKAKLCKEAGVSRPTIDKMLAGGVTSKANFDRHLKKMLDCLQITPDMLMGNAQVVKNQIHTIREVMRKKLEDIAAHTGINTSRLSEIESGGQATQSELRDISLQLATGTRHVLGRGFFDAQIAIMDDFLPDDSSRNSCGGCGFWGHIGILPTGGNGFCWYPITANARESIYRQMNRMDRIVVPCMNNRLLLINLQNIDQLSLLGEACSSPGDKNWDCEINCGEIPMVAYEALEDFVDIAYCDAKRDEDVMSPGFYAFMKNLFQAEGWDDSIIFKMQELILHYRDGKVQQSNFDRQGSSSLVSEVELLYNFESDAYVRDMLSYTDWNGEEILLNVRQLAFVDLPLLEVEDAICEQIELDERE